MLEADWQSECGKVRLWNADNMEIIGSLWPKDIAAIVTDPPYCIVRNGPNPFDFILFPDDIKNVVDVLQTLHTLNANIPTVCFASPDFWYPGKWGDLGFWQPTNSSQIHGHTRHNILTVNCGLGGFTYCEDDITVHHRYEKPVETIQKILHRLPLLPGNTIIDPWMGSGTTGIAAVREGFKFIGIEKDKQHFKTAIERLCNEPNLQNLRGDC